MEDLKSSYDFFSPFPKSGYRILLAMPDHDVRGFYVPRSVLFMDIVLSLDMSR